MYINVYFSSSQCQANIKCAKWQFACQNGKNCIYLTRKCDGLADCKDGSDEKACPFFSLPKLTTKNEWVCEDHKTTIKKRMVSLLFLCLISQVY